MLLLRFFVHLLGKSSHKTLRASMQVIRALYAQMKYLLLIFLLIPSVVFAGECPLVLSNFIEKLIATNQLQGPKNKFSGEILNEEFPESCEVNLLAKNYHLHLGNDDISIVVAVNNSENELYGRFYSAYRK